MMSPGADEPRMSRQLRPPSLGMMLAEVRGIFEFNASVMLSPLLMRAPRGDGHPVLALPGFLASDLSMVPIRRYLSELGYDAHAWQMGRNTRGLMQMRAGLRERLAGIHAVTGRKISIIGWSLGGIYARDLALWAPEMVRSVITLGSPFANDVRATNATRLYEAMTGETVGEDTELREAIAGDSSRGPDGLVDLSRALASLGGVYFYSDRLGQAESAFRDALSVISKAGSKRTIQAGLAAHIQVREMRNDLFELLIPGKIYRQPFLGPYLHRFPPDHGFSKIRF